DSEESGNILLYGISDFTRFLKYNTSYKTKEDYFQDSYNNIIEYEEKGYKVKIFYTTVNDYKEVESFSHFLSTRYEKKVEVAKINMLNDLISEIRNASLIISSRMHPLIIG